MAIITISRGSFSYGQKIAEKVAEMLGYECLSREILIEASKLFNVSEKKLMKSLHDAPSILERITHGRERYLSYIQTALLEHVKRDNIVYHGLAGHLLLAEIPQVLKVLVIAEIEDRIALLHQRQGIPRNQALAVVEKEDKHRTNWARYLYNTDVNDPRVYDIVIKIDRLKVQDACEIICCASRSEGYQTTVESKSIIIDLAISNHIKAALQSVCEAEVFVKDGVVHVKVSAQKIRKSGFISPTLQMHVGTTIQSDLTRQIVEIANKVPGVKNVFCDVDMPYYT